MKGIQCGKNLGFITVITGLTLGIWPGKVGPCWFSSGVWRRFCL